MEQPDVCAFTVERLTECTPEVVSQLNVLIPQLKPSWDPITAVGVTSVLDSPTRVYVARAAGVIVGVVLLVPHRHLPGLRYHVEDVIVDARFRRRGIARNLVTVAMDEAPSDVLSFDLRSHRIRRPAHDLYLSLGFEVSDTTVFRKIARLPSGPAR